MDVAAGKRAPNLGELINDLNRYARAVWPAAGKNPRMLAQQEPNVKKRFMKALEWYTTQLPLSRNELIVDLPKVEEGEEEEEDDEEDEDAVEKQGAFQLKVRAFKYGPWQVLAHRYAHWKMEEPYVGTVTWCQVDYVLIVGRYRLRFEMLGWTRTRWIC